MFKTITSWYRILFLSLLLVGGIFFYTRFDTISANDRSRFGTIRGIVEHHSFILDDSLFPTIDKVFIKGNFYSDKPPVLSVIASLPYAIFYFFGITWLRHSALIMYVTTLFAVGLPYLLYVFLCAKKFHSINHISNSLLLGMATMLWPYATTLNNHVPAAVLTGISFAILWDREDVTDAPWLLIGALLGLGTVIDPGVVFFTFSVGLYCLWYLFARRKIVEKKVLGKILFFFVSGLCIPLFIHCILNFQITGDLLPGSFHPEYFVYPGSQFNVNNLTSAGWSAHSVGGWLTYLNLLTFGTRGFFIHNPLVIVGIILLTWVLIRNFNAHRRALALVVLLTYAMTVGYYSLRSSEAGGWAYSVRWFCFLIPLTIIPLTQWFNTTTGWQYRFVMLVAVLSVAMQIPALGNVLGKSFQNPHQYSFLQAFKDFNQHTEEQKHFWKSFAK